MNMEHNIKRILKGFLVATLSIVASCVWVPGIFGAFWIGGVVHSFRHHNVANGIFAIIIPYFGVFRGVEGLFSNESGLLGFNLDEGSADMRLKIEEEYKKEDDFRKLLSVESNRMQYIPADNTGNIREIQRLDDEWRGRLYSFRATAANPADKAKVDQFLELMDELNASYRRQRELMDQLAKKFPERKR
jgi:hypothetical protein